MNGLITALTLIILPLVGILSNLFLSQLDDAIAARGRTRDWLLFFTIFLPTAITSWLLLLHLHAQGAYSFNWLPGVQAGLRLTEFSIVFACIVANLSALVALYSISFMRDDSSMTRFWFFYLLTLEATLLVIFADNLYWLFGGLAVASLGAFFLISHWHKKSGEKGTKAANAAIRYLIISFCGDILLLLSFSFMIVSFKSATISTLLNSWLAPPESILLGSSNNTRLLIKVLLLFGALIKAGQFPLLLWPFTSERKDRDLAKSPLPASLFLITTIGSSALFLLGTFKSFFYSRSVEIGTDVSLYHASTLQLIGWFAIITLILIVLVLAVTNSLNRLLVGLAIAQQSFSLLAFSTGSTTGYVAAVFNLIIGLPATLAIVFVFGSILESLRIAALSKIIGIKQKQPRLFILGVLALVNFAGIFPSSVYFSRDMIFTALKTSRVPGALGLLVLGLLCLLLLIALTIKAFQKTMQGNFSEEYAIRKSSTISLMTIGFAFMWSFLAGIALLFYNYPETFLFSGLLNKIFSLEYFGGIFSDKILSPILLCFTLLVFMVMFFLYRQPNRPSLQRLTTTKFSIAVQGIIKKGFYLDSVSEFVLVKPLSYLERFFAWLRIKSSFASVIWAILSLVLLVSILVLVGGFG